MVRLTGSDLVTYEALYKHQGARIMFKCDEVTYQGIIDVILPDICLVKLRHVKIVEGDHYLGNLRFKFREIASFKVIESSESVNRYPRNDYLLNILKNNRPVPNSTVAKALYGDKFSDDSDDDSTDKTKVEEKFVLELPSHLEHLLPKEHSQIHIIDEHFYQAIQCIRNQEVIGVSFHGSQISRFGKLFWLCISTDTCSYLFDIHQLGKEAFDRGLRKILESKCIKKVIHDSRFPSDCLAHQYATVLNNVFDTRVADFVISMQKYSKKYKIQSFGSLDYCLRIYLKVPQEFLFQRETSNPNQESFFCKRPVTNAYLYDLLKSVLYLKLLKEKLLKELFAPFRRAVGFYRTVIAKSSTELINTLGSDLSRPDQIPPCLIMNGIQTVYFVKPENIKSLPLRCAFVHPKTGEVIRPYLGSLAAVQDSLRVSLEKKKISNKKNDAEKKRNATKKEMIPFSSNDVEKTLDTPAEYSTSQVDSVICKPSFRQMDEVYHRLANRVCPDPSSSYVSVRPSANYFSKFFDKKCALARSKANVCDKKNESVIDDVSTTSSKTDKNVGESGDIWLKLQAEAIAEKANSSLASYGERKITFVPG